ncbi:hypothetical protein DFP72DRAFT_875339 [Ephemerocybe angulata]|uniref:CCHC-type domain-containing protein n=1 Tax=Ephemerocybe angulata TaxID=980116 RepID=A0A8H6ID26_9AGAR|nr:hypothetical protein DFP72DRAFT_875339 [Tulosesus angulatus]
MTRVTNFGRKRTYVEAGFAGVDEDHILPQPSAQTHVQTAEAIPSTSNAPEQGQSSKTGDVSNGGPQQKKKAKGTPNEAVPRKHPKRHRSKKGKGPGAGMNIPKAEKEKQAATSAAAAGSAPGADAVPRQSALPNNGWVYKDEPASDGQPPAKKSRIRQPKDGMPRGSRPNPKEQRRLARIDEKLRTTTCFACREKGHAAKDCPKASELGATAEEETQQKGGAPVTGICYRCGATNHNLSRCHKLADPENPLPFASCFVCSGKGHLAGNCPQNKDRGVYPNGGCCKICGDTTHLAKECGVRRNEPTIKAAVGMGAGAGADEDDFMVINRRAKEVEKEEHVEERLKKVMDASERAPTMLKGSAVPAKKKVVVF